MAAEEWKEDRESSLDKCLVGLPCALSGWPQSVVAREEWACDSEVVFLNH